MPHSFSEYTPTQLLRTALWVDWQSSHKIYSAPIVYESLWRHQEIQRIVCCLSCWQLMLQLRDRHAKNTIGNAVETAWGSISPSVVHRESPAPQSWHYYHTRMRDAQQHVCGQHLELTCHGLACLIDTRINGGPGASYWGRQNTAPLYMSTS